MIASVSGKVMSITPSAAVIDVGGVGFYLNITNRTAKALTVGQSAALSTALVVREDSLTLYGFGDTAELETFELLRSVNGVGPKSALSILSALTVKEISDAVAQESDEVFKSVSGVGAKTAKLITLSLSGKLPGGSLEQVSSGGQTTVDALVGLGYGEREAKAAVQKVVASGSSDQEILKLALQSLARGGLK